MIQNRYFVYIITNYNRTVLYTGVTNNLNLRLQQHAEDALGPRISFAGKYQCLYLLHFEEYQIVEDAIAREKEIKQLSRIKKEEMIRISNPQFTFLNHQKHPTGS